MTLLYTIEPDKERLCPEGTKVLVLLSDCTDSNRGGRSITHTLSQQPANIV